MDKDEIMLMEIIAAIKNIRVPFLTDEYQLHDMVARELAAIGVSFLHEYKLAPRCRIDFLCGNVGIEIKRGRPPHSQLLAQAERYAIHDEIKYMVIIVERTAMLPKMIGGKRMETVALNRLWGVALS